MEIVLDASAQDLVSVGGAFEIHGAPGDFLAIKEALEKAEVRLVDASVTQVPDNTVEVPSVEDARKIVKLIDTLEDHDDAQTVSANHRLSDEIAGQLAEEG